MAIKWTNRAQVNRMFQEEQFLYDIKSIREMMVIGERCVKRAREQGAYKDQTANLRNSIGYVVVHNNQIVFDAFNGDKTGPKSKPGDMEFARQQGLAYAKRIGDELKGYKTYLVVVAGMEYAVFVEDLHGIDVLQSTADWVEASRTELMDEFRRYLMSDKI